MERWRNARQDKVWTGRKVKQLEHRFNNTQEHELLMQKTASFIVGDSVLDVGCGFGHLYEYIITKNIRYVGVDQSRDMLNRARVRYPHATFIQQNLYMLDQPKADTVTCLDLLHHQPALEPAFSILMKHASKLLIVSIWIHERYKHGKHKKKYVGHSGEIICWHTEKELQRKFAGIEYTVIRGVGWSWRDLYCFVPP